MMIQSNDTNKQSEILSKYFSGMYIDGDGYITKISQEVDFYGDSTMYVYYADGRVETVFETLARANSSSKKLNMSPGFHEVRKTHPEIMKLWIGPKLINTTYKRAGTVYPARKIVADMNTTDNRKYGSLELGWELISCTMIYGICDSINEDIVTILLDQTEDMNVMQLYDCMTEAVTYEYESNGTYKNANLEISFSAYWMGSLCQL